uniref:Minor capsid protein P9 transmembrane helices domain-containing protein n=1 Tax=viral metagenome TaxID=1070528 RepID=A0A6C0CH14_9ZZZZ
MTDTIWFKDPAILFSANTWSQFVPTKAMSTAQALNSVVRFSVYFSVILFLATQKTGYLLAIPAVMAASVALFSLFPHGKVLEAFKAAVSGKQYTMPTPANPFMNPLLTEIQDNPNRPDAAPVTRSDVKAGIFKAFQQTSDLYMDTSDLFDQARAMVNYHTLQSATIPNDQDGFLKWLAKGYDAPDYSSAFPARNAKIQSEGYAPAAGSVTGLPPTTTSKPSGTDPSGPLPAKSSSK